MLSLTLIQKIPKKNLVTTTFLQVEAASMSPWNQFKNIKLSLIRKFQSPLDELIEHRLG